MLCSKTLQAGTEFTVCQTPEDTPREPVLCVRVERVKWSGSLEVKTIVYPKGHGNVCLQGRGSRCGEVSHR